jgi:hypothetical protein
MPQSPAVAGFSYSLKHAGGRCRAYSFKYWALMNGQALMEMRLYLEFAREKERPDSLLVRGRLPSGWDLSILEYTKPIYRIALTGKPTAVEVTEEEWKRAQVLNPHKSYEERDKENAFGKRVAEEDHAVLNGHRLPIRGEFWPYPNDRVDVSPSGRYAVLHSMNGKFDERRGEFYRGRFYYQIYDLNTGEEIFWVDGSWRGAASWSFFTLTDWVTDNMVVLIPDPEARTGVLLCNVPE